MWPCSLADRLSLSFSRSVRPQRASLYYGQLEYLRDTFKLIDYLVAPTAGVGYKVVSTTATKFSTDAGPGVVWERNPGVDLRDRMALTAGEKLEHALTATATLKHAATG